MGSGRIRGRKGMIINFSSVVRSGSVCYLIMCKSLMVLPSNRVTGGVGMSPLVQERRFLFESFSFGSCDNLFLSFFHCLSHHQCGLLVGLLCSLVHSFFGLLVTHRKKFAFGLWLQFLGFFCLGRFCLGFQFLGFSFGLCRLGFQFLGFGFGLCCRLFLGLGFSFLCFCCGLFCFQILLSLFRLCLGFICLFPFQVPLFLCILLRCLFLAGLLAFLLAFLLASLFGLLLGSFYLACLFQTLFCLQLCGLLLCSLFLCSLLSGLFLCSSLFLCNFLSGLFLFSFLRRLFFGSFLCFLCLYRLLSSLSFCGLFRNLFLSSLQSLGILFLCDSSSGCPLPLSLCNLKGLFLLLCFSMKAFFLFNSFNQLFVDECLEVILAHWRVELDTLEHALHHFAFCMSLGLKGKTCLLCERTPESVSVLLCDAVATSHHAACNVHVLCYKLPTL